jgi:hypothetical protein
VARTSSLLLTPDGDLAREGGRFQVAKGKTYLGQKIVCVIRFWKGEYPFDLSVGFPWDEVAVGVKDPSPELIRSELRRHISSIQGVTAVRSVDLEIDQGGRVLSGKAQAEGDLGLLLQTFEVPLL